MSQEQQIEEQGAMNIEDVIQEEIQVVQQQIHGSPQHSNKSFHLKEKAASQKQSPMPVSPIKSEKQQSQHSQQSAHSQQANQTPLNQSAPVHPQQHPSEQNQQQVFTYKAPWPIYSMGFASRPTTHPRIAIGSMNDDPQNEVCILQLDKENEKFEKKCKFSHRYAPTKVLWIPDTNGRYSDLLATSGEYLKIYEIDDENDTAKLKWELINASDFNAPLTSFDWNCKSLNYIGTASIDTTCTLWEVEKQTVFTQLIAHDKEVYDICFSVDQQIFASVGADGSCRQFDLRTLDHSTVLYETENNNPIVRLAWNKIDTNYLAIIEMDVNYITLLDTRVPLYPVTKLKNHKEYVNAITWAPESAYHLCSVSDDSTALIWDLSELQNRNDPTSNIDPLLEYKAESEISNLSWSLVKPELLSICYSKCCQILNV